MTAGPPPEGWIGPWPIPDGWLDPNTPWPPPRQRRGLFETLRDAWSDWFGATSERAVEARHRRAE